MSALAYPLRSRLRSSLAYLDMGNRMMAPQPPKCLCPNPGNLRTSPYIARKDFADKTELRSPRQELILDYPNWPNGIRGSLGEEGWGPRAAVTTDAEVRMMHLRMES